MLPITEQTNVSYTQVELPSGKKIGIKPWRVKEERELLFAVEGQENEDDVRKEIVKLISKCCDNQDMFNSLSNVDYVFMLAQLRKLSKGTKIEYTLKCTNPSCKFELSDDIDLDSDLQVKKYKQTTVKINDTLSIALKEVSFKEFDGLKQKYTKLTEYNYHFILKSIDTIIVGEQIYSEFTKDELATFIDELKPPELKILSDAIDDSIAEIELKKELTCKRCGTKNDVNFGDLYYFLGF